MSIRTIIEINHDHLDTLFGDAENGAAAIRSFLLVLFGSKITGQLNNGETPEPITGIRILAQRHHSDTLKLTINRWTEAEILLDAEIARHKERARGNLINDNT